MEYNDTEPTEYSFHTTNKYEAKCMMVAMDMAGAIGSCYYDVLRNKYKHQEGMTEEQYTMYDDISERLIEHFQDFEWLQEG